MVFNQAFMFVDEAGNQNVPIETIRAYAHVQDVEKWVYADITFILTCHSCVTEHNCIPNFLA